MGARVDYGTGLENQRASHCTVGSNPSPSAAMRFMLTCVLIWLFFIFPAQAQISGLADLYKLDDFSSSASVPALRDYVTLEGGFAGRHLVLTAKIASGWHLYSVTQPVGGTLRTIFSFEPPSSDFDPEPVTTVPTTPPKVNSDVPGFDVDIEEHDDSVTWLVTFKQDWPKDTRIRGLLEGQVCQAGEGGTCIPISIPFEIAFDEKLDVQTHLDATARIEKRFVYAMVIVPPAVKFAPQEIVEVDNFGMVLLYAFLGGLILNIMPCVLPVIGLKILSFFEQAGKSRARAFYLNVSYSLGLLSVFLFLAAMSYGLSQLFSFDLFSIVMACVVFAMALSLMDVWAFSVPSFVNTILGSGTSQKLTRQEGAAGAFFKGIITTLLAIPCGAPLLSPAVNWADMQIRSGNTGLVFVAYAVIGLGMASPYLVIGAFPELLRFLPKPGAWMETFKKVMGYCLLPAVIWILYFIQLEKLLPTVTLLFSLWFACWVLGRLTYTAKAAERVTSWILALLVVAATLACSFNLGLGNPYTLENAMLAKLARSANVANPNSDAGHWTLYTPERFEKALQSGKPVMVDFTADWCINCKALEMAVLQSQPILDKMHEQEVVSFMADRTKEGDASEFLRTLGADIVPTLAIFDPKNPTEPIILRGGYTRKTLLELLETVGD